MSEITLNVRDAQRALHHTVHASRVDVLVAALSADPETIEELQAALRRFLPANSARDFFAGWASGTRAESWDAGLCVIDLAARLVMIHSSYSSPGTRGKVYLIEASREEGVTVSYHLADDWLFLCGEYSWEAQAEERRRKRLAEPPIDTREVLYGKLCEFIAQAATTEGDARERIAAVHACWLMTPRSDLAGAAPRDVLLSRHAHISWDLQDRSEQWSLLDACPPGLSPENTAYRYGGFGTHEIVLYYELVRFLLHEWRIRQESSADGPPTNTFGDDVRWLEALRDEWLESPDGQDLDGRTPASVIAHERARLPEGSTGAEAMVDHDCPMCQMMADLPGPVFWQLDGCNMDHDFAFSFHRTRQEWEAEQREWEEPDRRIEADRRSQPFAASESVWQTSYANEESAANSPALALFGLGAHLAELTQDLNDVRAAPDVVDQLLRAFGNVRDAVKTPASSLIEPIIDKMCELLARVADIHPALADKCADLERRFSTLAQRFMGEPDWDEELPF